MYQVFDTAHPPISRLLPGLSAIMLVQYASCSSSILGVYCNMLSAAMPYVPLLLSLAAGTVAATFYVVLLLLLSLSCAGEVISSAQAPFQ